MKALLGTMLLALTVGINCQIAPTEEQLACFLVFFTNNPTSAEVAALSNCPDLAAVTSNPGIVCENQSCIDALDTIYTSGGCNFDLPRGKG